MKAACKWSLSLVVRENSILKWNFCFSLPQSITIARKLFFLHFSFTLIAVFWSFIWLSPWVGPKGEACVRTQPSFPVSVSTNENGVWCLKRKWMCLPFIHSHRPVEIEFKHSLERNIVYKGWGLENLRYIWNLERSLGVNWTHGREGKLILLRILVLTPPSL